MQLKSSKLVLYTRSPLAPEVKINIFQTDLLN